MRRITVVSVLARCDMVSNEHSEAAAFFSEAWGIDRLCDCVPSHLSENMRMLCTK
jgi:hypothetical protein